MLSKQQHQEKKNKKEKRTTNYNRPIHRSQRWDKKLSARIETKAETETDKQTDERHRLSSDWRQRCHRNERRRHLATIKIICGHVTCRGRMTLTWNGSCFMWRRRQQSTDRKEASLRMRCSPEIESDCRISKPETRLGAVVVVVVVNCRRYHCCWGEQRL